MSTGGGLLGRGDRFSLAVLSTGTRAGALKGG